MKNKVSNIIEHDPFFKTKRIVVQSMKSYRNNSDLIKSVFEIMTPAVVKSLPDGWHNLQTKDQAKRWIEEREEDSDFYIIRLTNTNDIIGFLFLYTAKFSRGVFDLRLGYLLRESIWGIGIGSELIEGLVSWAKRSTLVASISGGVEKENLASIRVLEKNGFKRSSDELPEGMLLYVLDVSPS